MIEEAWLCLDPSMSNVGFSFFINHKLIDSGVSSPKGLEDLKGSNKYIAILDQHLNCLRSLIEKHSKNYDVLVIHSEQPYGSQSYHAAINVGLCIGLIAALRSVYDSNSKLVMPRATKKCLTGSDKATKQEMITEAYKLYPEANWVKDKKGSILLKNEHLADSLAVHNYFKNEESNAKPKRASKLSRKKSTS